MSDHSDTRESNPRQQLDMSPLHTEDPLAMKTSIMGSTEYDESDSDEDECRPLLPTSASVDMVKKEYYESSESSNSNGKLQAMVLSVALCTVLLNFWMLDSLKDPVLESLTQNLQKHQPLAKMASVASTLTLVCLMEYVLQERQRQRRHDALRRGVAPGVDESISVYLFYAIGTPYCIVFLLLSFCIKQHPKVDENAYTMWHVLGYLQYVAIESYGSITVAAFWSFCNSRLDLASAEKYYGFMIAVAQVGAIVGATIPIVKSDAIPQMMRGSAGLVLLSMAVMTLHHFWFDANDARPQMVKSSYLEAKSMTSGQPTKRPETTPEPSVFSGVHLMLKHTYVLYILGVSCLYEVAMTCLDYEMKLVGLAKFQANASELVSAVTDVVPPLTSVESTFTTFMGHFGQLVNVLSLLLSYFGFPWLMKHLGLRRTLPIFPCVLLSVTIVMFAMTPNLWLIFICLALLKAMTYSINEPSKEILYIPTSNTIKLKAKFWIDVVGSRCAKALGSSITNYAGNADRLITFGAFPSIITSLVLLAVSVRAGDEFQHLADTGEVIGLRDELEEAEAYDDENRSVYLNVSDDESHEDANLLA